MTRDFLRLICRRCGSLFWSKLYETECRFCAMPEDWTNEPERRQ